MTEESETFKTLNHFEQTEYKAFRSWLNINLSPLNDSVECLERDLVDGVKLCKLLEKLQNKTIGKYDKNPKMQMQKLSNLSIFLKALTNDGLKVVNIGPEDIYNGNIKILFGVLWLMIQKYHINQLDFLDEEIETSQLENTEQKPTRKQSIHVSGIKKMDTKEKILFIINDIVEAWGLKANNFTSDFSDGKILTCLAYTRDPKSVVNPKFIGDDAHQNTKNALLAFESMGVPHVVDVEEITEKHNEKSIMTLLGYIIRELSSRDQIVYHPDQDIDETDRKSVV